MRSGRGLLVLIALLLVSALAACSSDGSDGSDGSDRSDGAMAADEIVVAADTVLIDVRTPEEFAEGHLDGAVNISLQADDFDARIDELDRDGTYVVYCRTGNRSAQAAAAMVDAGFTDVTDAGGIDEAAASTGIEVVTP